MSLLSHQTRPVSSTINRKVSTGHETFIDGIHVYVVRKRVKNMNLRITSTGEVHLSVPYGVDHEQIEAMVHKHRSWILRNQARVQQRSTQSRRLFAEGEKLFVWGVPRSIEYVDPSEAAPAVANERGIAVAHSPHGSTTKPTTLLSEKNVLLVLPHELRDNGAEHVESRRQLVLDLFAREVRREVEHIYPACATEVGAHATSITVRYMTSRWGSCTPSTRRIRINSALAAYDPQCLRQVLVHELCHIHEPNHSPRFWALMDQHCPDWRTWQAELKSRGPFDQPQAT